MKTSYRHLAVLLYPDKVRAVQPLCADRCLKVLTRALQQAESEVWYKELDEYSKDGEAVLVPAFTVSRASHRDIYVYRMEPAERKHGDRSNETQRKSRWGI